MNQDVSTSMSGWSLLNQTKLRSVSVSGTTHTTKGRRGRGDVGRSVNVAHSPAPTSQQYEPNTLLKIAQGFGTASQKPWYINFTAISNSWSHRKSLSFTQSIFRMKKSLKRCYTSNIFCCPCLDIQDEAGVRQQFNSQSSFLDADNVYGYSEQRARQVFHVR